MYILFYFYRSYTHTRVVFVDERYIDVGIKQNFCCILSKILLNVNVIFCIISQWYSTLYV